MRDILEKLIALGVKVVISEEAGVPVIRLYRGNEMNASTLVATCSLGAGRFRADSEDALNSMLLDLERK